MYDNNPEVFDLLDQNMLRMRQEIKEILKLKEAREVLIEDTVQEQLRDLNKLYKKAEIDVGGYDHYRAVITIEQKNAMMGIRHEDLKINLRETLKKFAREINDNQLGDYKSIADEYQKSIAHKVNAHNKSLTTDSLLSKHWCKLNDEVKVKSIDFIKGVKERIDGINIVRNSLDNVVKNTLAETMDRDIYKVMQQVVQSNVPTP